MPSQRKAELEGIPGRLLEEGGASDAIVWRADGAGSARETGRVLGRLGERKAAAASCRLELLPLHPDDPSPSTTVWVDLVALEFHEQSGAIVAELRRRPDGGRRGVSGDAEAYAEEEIDETLEASFPASDPPAFEP